MTKKQKAFYDYLQKLKTEEREGTRFVETAQKEFFRYWEKYEKDGVIKGHKAIINFNNVPGAKATAYIELKVTPQKDTGFDTIAKQILDFDEVDSLYLMAGGYDLLACVKGDSITDIAMFVAKRLSTIDGVLSTNTRFQLKTYKKSGISFYDDDEQDKRSIIL